MTVTSLAPGAPAPHRRSIRRLLATGVAAALLLVGPPTASATALTPIANAAETPAPSPTEAASGELELVLVPGANGVVGTGQAFVATVHLRNGTADPTDPARVSLRLGTTPLDDRAALDSWLGGEGDDALPEVATADLPAVDADADLSAALTLAAEDPALAGRAPGVYPVQATVTIDGDELSSVGTIVVPDDGAAVTPVGVVVPITAGPLETGLLDETSVATLTAADGRLTAQLDAVEGTSAILAIDPAIPAAIRVLGSAAPRSAVDWLERLDNLPNSRFALQFGDADVASQLQAGLAEPLQPTSLLSAMRAVDFGSSTDVGATPSPTSTSTTTPAPTATDSPDAPAYPDLATLTDVGGSPRADVFWPADGSAGAEVVTTLGSLGESGQSLTLVSSTSTAAGAGGETVTARRSAGDAQVLVYDASSSTALTRAAGEDDTTTRAAALAAATAELAMAAADAEGRPLLVTLDRDDDRGRVALRAAITAASSAPATTPIGLDELAATAPEGVELASAESDPTRTADLTQLLSDEAAVGEFATILDDPQLLTGPQRAEILQLLGVAWHADADAAHAAVVSHRDATAETLDAVGILSTNVILASYGSDGFRPYVRNDLPYPVNLVFAAQPDTSSVEIDERIEVRAPAASNTRVNLSIEARIANATAVVSMQLYSPSGVAIGAVESATVEVHADWENTGLTILIVLMAVFVGGGVFRTVRRRRRRRRDQETLTLEPEARVVAPIEAGAGGVPDAAGPGTSPGTETPSPPEDRT